jgi:hypothetical protein
VRKRIRLIAICGGGVLLAVGALLAIYGASQHVPGFYREALAANRADSEKASSEMLQQITAFASDLRKEGPWQAVFTASQINGWLAVDFARDYSAALGTALQEPRAAIQSDRVAIACRLAWGHLSSVVTLTAEPYLAEPGVLALRLRGAKAGMLPLPLRKVVDEISATARHTELNLRWRKVDGDPVALISFVTPADAKGKHVRIESLRLANGEIYIAGTTETAGRQ